MIKRPVQKLFRLSRQENEKFTALAKRAGITQAAYFRHLINGVVPSDAPPPDYYAMMREIHKLGVNMNQVAQKAHVLNVIDANRYDKSLQTFYKTITEITGETILPHKPT
ncbi:MAG: plasmid mobilization relaxosome protein MobC [Oscillospiraceae bacterium]